MLSSSPRHVPTVVGDTVNGKESFNEFYYCLMTLKPPKCGIWLSIASALCVFLRLCLSATEQGFASLSLLIRCKNLPFGVLVLSLDFSVQRLCSNVAVMGEMVGKLT